MPLWFRHARTLRFLPLLWLILRWLKCRLRSVHQVEIGLRRRLHGLRIWLSGNWSSPCLTAEWIEGWRRLRNSPPSIIVATVLLVKIVS
jgi:hypothetical protein